MSFGDDTSRVCRHPFRKGDGWLVWGALGVVAAPVVVAATAFAISALGYSQVRTAPYP